jgi:uroporphyrinogen-III synthase
MNGFEGLRVLSLESRRAAELAKLISNYGGVPVSAPSMREVPLESNHEALAYAAKLFAGEFDQVIFMTGVGARALLAVVETKYPREEYVSALQRVKIVARGPKPVAALREIGITPTLTVPEPNTWREILSTLDDAGRNDEGMRLGGARVAVQEYGVSNTEFLSELSKRGAIVTGVPVYQWALPDDLGPLQAAIRALIDGNVDVVLFTTSVQAVHLFQVAAEMGLEDRVRKALRQIAIVSIGPTTSEELQRQGIPADFEPIHPKMGYLVKEAAERAGDILRHKQEGLRKALK